MISTGELKKGLTIIHDGELMRITDFQHVKQGRGSAYVRLTLRNVRTGATVNTTVQAGEKFDVAELEHKTVQFLYREDDTFYFMDTATYEQPAVGGAIQGQVSDLEIQAAEIERMRTLMDTTLARHTGKDPAVIRKDTDRDKILTAEEMGLSKEILELCHLNKGLVLVTGPTGSGKSTTLAAMVDYVNRTRTDHIITIEDPLEFVHENKKCLINQRQVGDHTASFKDALRAALREDPDIVLVGEMRDLETVAIAIETAETGHLVFGTLHTSSAPSTVDRIIDQFPADRQGQIRVMLAESLKGVISQLLCKKIGGGRVPVLEVLISTPSVSNLIREGKVFQIPSIMQTGKKYGMIQMNDSFTDLGQECDNGGLGVCRDVGVRKCDPADATRPPAICRSCPTPRRPAPSCATASTTTATAPSTTRAGRIA